MHVEPRMREFPTVIKTDRASSHDRNAIIHRFLMPVADAPPGNFA